MEHWLLGGVLADPVDGAMLVFRGPQKSANAKTPERFDHTHFSDILHRVRESSHPR